MRPILRAKARVASGIAAALLVFAATAHISAAPSSSTANAKAADAFQRKLEFVQANAKADPPNPKPTEFKQNEINAYFSEGRLKLPEGVENVQFTLRDAEVEATTRVDFERLRNSRPNMNPLLAIFDGVHDCQVIAQTEPAGPGRVRVHVDSVVIDGMSVPRMALEMFIKHYVNPKYPSVALDNEYQLPARIDSAVIKPGAGIIIQK